MLFLRIIIHLGYAVSTGRFSDPSEPYYVTGITFCLHLFFVRCFLMLVSEITQNTSYGHRQVPWEGLEFLEYTGFKSESRPSSKRDFIILDNNSQ